MLKRIWLGLAVVTALVLGTVAVAAALNTADTNTAEPPAQEPTETEDGTKTGAGEEDDKTFTTEKMFHAGVDEGSFLDDEWDDFDDNILPPELIAEINADTDALVEHLTGLGFDVTTETDDNGVRYPVFANEDDDALWQAFEDYEQAQLAAEAATWTDEEKAEHNAWIDEFVADLAAEGTTVVTHEIAPGVRDIIWTDALDNALDVLDEEDLFHDEWEECKIVFADIDG